MNKITHRIYISGFLLISLFTTAILVYYGYSYYSLPIEERFFHPLYELLKPSGLLGHGFGIIGSIFMLLGVSIYMIRKRYKKIFRLGKLKHWLEFHIFLCSLGPILVLFHTSFKFGGLVSVSFWSMVAVVLSGVIGRFIYIQIPRTIQGNELSIDDLMRQNTSINDQLRTEYAIQSSTLSKLDDAGKFGSISRQGHLHKLFFLFEDKWSNYLLLNKLRFELKATGVEGKDLKILLKIIKTKLVLQRRIVLLSSMKELFRYWHVAHLPFAIIMLIIMLIHVGVSITFGYTWIF